jgi:nucleoside-diphosphate-sugar epimerase
MARKKVLVTGMSGLIGSAVRSQLGEKYELSALNRREIPGVPCHRADIADLEAILPAFAGIETVIHLAAIARMDVPWEDLLHANVIGTYNVFEAARRAGVKRVVYASSGATVAGWEREMPYRALVADGPLPEQGSGGEPERWEKLTHESPVRPMGIYGCTKVWGEALARHFSDTSDLSILCLRIGSVNAEDRPRSRRERSVWCSRRDIVQMIERCVDAPDGLRFDTFFVTSNNRRSYRDLEHPRQILGFVPQDSAEEHA